MANTAHNPCSMFHRERPEKEYGYVGISYKWNLTHCLYRPLYKKYGLSTTTWSSLAGGLLTGKVFSTLDALPTISLKLNFL